MKIFLFKSNLQHNFIPFLQIHRKPRRCKTGAQRSWFKETKTWHRRLSDTQRESAS